MKNADVLALIEARIPAKVVAEKVNRAPGAYDLEPESLLELKKAGVSGEIIMAMLKSA